MEVIRPQVISLSDTRHRHMRRILVGGPMVDGDTQNVTGGPRMGILAENEMEELYNPLPGDHGVC